MSLRALLAEVVERPDDDVPRMVLADWLLDQPDAGSAARGELIHAQCRLARMAPDDPQRDELEARALQLLPGPPQRWARRLRRAGVKKWWFSRGLIEGVKLDTVAFDRLADRLCRLSPVRHLHLRPGAGWVERLLAWPDLDRVCGLRPGFLDMRLLCSPRLAGLRALDLRDVPGGLALVQLASAPCAASLESLDLRNLRCTAADLRQVLRPDRLPRLRDLSLDYSRYVFAHQAPSVLPAVLPQLVRLRLRYVQYTLAPLAEMLSRVPQSPLEEMVLVEPVHGGPGPLADLLRLPAVARLRSLELHGVALTAEALTALLDLLDRGRLVRLVLTGSTPEALIEALVNSGKVGRLRELVLRGSPPLDMAVPRRAVRALASARGLGSLVSLDLSGSNLAADHLESLLAAPFLEQLHTLVLTGNPLGVRAAGHLLTRGPWPRLARLALPRGALDAETFERLRLRFGLRVQFGDRG
jgi:uncharacterized protein (TIGR02996 family)